MCYTIFNIDSLLNLSTCSICDQKRNYAYDQWIILLPVFEMWYKITLYSVFWAQKWQNIEICNLKISYHVPHSPYDPPMYYLNPTLNRENMDKVMLHQT